MIFDLDGTLAEIEHRVPYVRQGPPDWKNFCERIPDDTLNDWCFELAGAISSGVSAVASIFTGKITPDGPYPRAVTEYN